MLNILRGCSCTGCTAKERNYHIHKRTSKCTVFDFNAACSKVSHICPINCLSFQKPRNDDASPDESVFQFQQIQKKEMIYFVLGLSISVSINKKTEKKMIFIFFLNCESPSTTHCCKKKMETFFFK